MARARALADIAQIFAEAALDLPVMLDRVTRRVGALMGDSCVIRLLSEDAESLRLGALYHPDPAAESAMRALLADMRHPAPDALSLRALQSGRTLLLAETTPESFSTGPRPENRSFLERFPIYSTLITPLQARGRMLGVLHMSRYRSGRPYTADDQRFIEELAERAALAIDNARLYQAEQHARAAAERAAERTAVLQAITAALSIPHTPKQIAEIVLTQGMAAVGATAGALSLLHDDGTFELVQMSGYPQQVVDTWMGRRYAGDTSAPIPDAVYTRAPIWLESPEAILGHYPVLAAELESPQTGAWATMPLLAEEQVFGGLTFVFAEPRVFDTADRRFMTAMAQQCAYAVARAQLHAAEQQARAAADTAHHRLALLAEASTRLASSLDYETTLALVVDLATEWLADWSSIYLLDDASAGHWVAATANDPAKRAILAELHERYPPEQIPSTLVARVLRTGSAGLVPEVSDEFMATAATDARHLELYRALGSTSYMVVPLRLHDRTRGLLVLAAAGSGRRYGADDLALAEELARRAVIAIENARLYREAQEAIRIRDVFFSIAAHELKTPLTSLLGQAQLLLRRATREGSLNERNQRSVEVVVAQAQRLNQLVLALLDAARIEQRQLRIDQAPLDLRALARRVVEEIQPTLDRHTLEYSEDGPLPIVGDALRLEQVLQNLIDNAIKYSPAGGQVTVRAWREGASACIAVADQGIGIPQAAVPHLFQRFYRAANVDERHISGIGIGLYLIKEIVALHNGVVQVESAEGAGSTFTIRLPLDAAEGQDEA